MGLAVHPQRVQQRLAQRLGIGDLLQQLHALVVLDALGLHLGDRLAALLVRLRHQHGERIVEDRLDNREHVQGVGVGLRVQQSERDEGEGRQRLVECEVRLQLEGQLQRAAIRVRRRQPHEHAGAHELVPERLRLLSKAPAPALVLVVVLHQRPHGLDRVRRLVDDVEDHRVVDAHPRHERLGHGVAQALERLLGPAHHPVGRLLGLDLAALLRIVARLGERARALDHMIGRLHDDVPARVEPGTSGASGDLMKLARLQQAVAAAVVLRQAREDHRADRDVDAHAERVGAADHLEQAGLRELLDQAPVARQHPSVMHPDAAPYELGERAPEAGGEAKRTERIRDRVALRSRAQLRREQ